MRSSQNGRNDASEELGDILRKNVTVCGWYGHGNVGDEAILEGVLESLTEISPEISVTVFSDNPKHTRKHHGVKSVRQNPTWREPLEKASLLLTYLWNDLFILGGGGFLSDWQSPTTPKLWLKRVWRAKILGKKTMAYGIGAGPITTKEGRYWTQKVLNTFDVITARDSVSKEWLKKAGVEKRVYVTADPALRLPVPDELTTENILRRCVPDRKKPLAVMSLAPIFHVDTYWPGMKGRYKRLVKDCASVIRFLRSELNLSVLMVPMHLGVDLPFHQAVVEESKVTEGVTLIDEQLSPLEVLAVYTDAELLITNRFHSILLASLCSVPSVGIVIHHKARCFLQDVGLEKISIPLGDGRLEADRDLDVRELKNSILFVMENQERLRTQISTRVERLKKREKLNMNLCSSVLLK